MTPAGISAGHNQGVIVSLFTGNIVTFPIGFENIKKIDMLSSVSADVNKEEREKKNLSWSSD